MRPLLLLILLMLSATPLAASHGHGVCWYTSQPEIDTGPSPAGRFYVDNDLMPDWWSLWGYEESNGIDGLQRADEMSDDLWECRQLGIDVRGDTIVF